MDELVYLSDEEVLVSARHWRAQALRGVLHARRFAHDYELEVRRRGPKPARAADASVPEVAVRGTFWRLKRFWRL